MFLEATGEKPVFLAPSQSRIGLIFFVNRVFIE